MLFEYVAGLWIKNFCFFGMGNNMQKSLILAAVTPVFLMLATVAQATEPLALQGVMKVWASICKRQQVR